MNQSRKTFSCVPHSRTAYLRPLRGLGLFLLLLLGAQGSVWAQWGVWHQLQTYPSPRTGYSTALLDGFIYMFGGRNGTTNYNTTHRSYAPTIGGAQSNWVAMAPMQTTRYFAAAAAGANGKIYVIGGYVNGATTPSNLVEEYDPTTNTWSYKATIPTARARMKAVKSGNLIYVMGGVNALGNALNVMQIYNPATNTWSTGPAMPTAKADFGATECRLNWTGDRRIYVMGGRASATATSGSNTVEVFSTQSSTWASGPFNLPVAVYGNSATWDTTDSRIYSTGGWLAGGTTQTNAIWETYLPLTQNWHTFPALARPMADHHVFTSATTNLSMELFALGGITGSNVLDNHYEHVWIWIVLPAQQISLTAQASDNQVAVQWEHDPSDVVSYRIERSADGVQFAQVGPELQPGNANLHQTIDANPLAGASYYRVGIRYADGRQQISEAVAVTVVHPQLLARVITNDLTHIYTLQYQLPQAESHASVSLSDIGGKRLRRFDLTENQGILPMDLALYPAGIYFVHVATPTQSKTLKIRVL
jgi:Kelch motif